MPNDSSRLELRLLLLAGFGACFAYPVGIFAPMPMLARTVLVAAFGPLLGLGCYGFYRILSLERRSAAGAIGAASNAIAGALFTAMILVQLAAGHRSEDRFAVAVWSGLDVAWDLYIGLGTAFFALAAYKHPWFGRVFGIPGLVIAGLLLGLNLLTFPTPPANAGFFDAGPLMGLWYLAVTIAAWAGLRRMERPEVPMSIPSRQPA